MRDAKEWSVRIVKNDAAHHSQAQDEEYLYWQGPPALERIIATQELSLMFFKERHNDEAKSRQQFLRSPVCLPLVPRSVSDHRGLGG
jgi:hypothetical protein